MSCMNAVIVNPGQDQQDWFRAEQEILKRER